jgi:tRNA A37 threonylcarbamoyladenosine synthetase subunit TsaC/SUA5/YrdC
LQLPGEADGEAPSTVVDATGDELRVLREGAIPARALRAGAQGKPDAEGALE